MSSEFSPGLGISGRLSENKPGTGIGLAIVARAMQRMGGVESGPGPGSRFWLELMTQGS